MQLVDAQTAVGPLPLGEWVTLEQETIHDYKTIVFNLPREPRPTLIGWADQLEGGLRWSICERSDVVFSAENLDPAQHLYTITLRLYGTKPQQVNVHLNDFLVTSGHWDDTTATHGELHLSIDNSMLNFNGHNALTFSFPDIEPFSLGEQRLLGIGLAGIKLEAITSE